MFREIALNCFIADGGVDDFETMTDDELKAIAAWYLRTLANDDTSLGFIVREARTLNDELMGGGDM